MAITGQAALRSPLSGRTSPRAVFQLTKALNRSVVQSTLMAEMKMPASGPVARCSHTLPFRPALVIRPTQRRQSLRMPCPISKKLPSPLSRTPRPEHSSVRAACDATVSGYAMPTLTTFRAIVIASYGS